VGYKIIYTHQAEKDARRFEQSSLDKKTRELLAILKRKIHIKHRHMKNFQEI
jgi:hypothetical protein